MSSLVFGQENECMQSDTDGVTAYQTVTLVCLRFVYDYCEGAAITRNKASCF